MDGWIVLDKPSGITSAHAVAKVKRLFSSPRRGERGRGAVYAPLEQDCPHPNPPSTGEGKIKIGHAGTLDPLASGVLPLALGEATKTVAYMMDAAKAYAFTVTWGEERDTDDLEGRVTQISGKRPSQSDIEAILAQFTGEILQLPPSYSALKIDGKRAYELAREGEAVELKPRKVRVDALIIAPSPLRGEGRGGGASAPTESVATPTLTLPPQGGGDTQTTFLCHCGKGTYIRSLARDMGRVLGCFGHVSMLRRLKVGGFSEKDAISLELLEEMVHKGALGFLKPVASALDDILARDIDESQAARLRRGQPIMLPLLQEKAGTPVLARHDGRPVAICAAGDGFMKPVRVFNL